jgi:hypothetical protein
VGAPVYLAVKDFLVVAVTGGEGFTVNVNRVSDASFHPWRQE